MTRSGGGREKSNPRLFQSSIHGMIMTLFECAKNFNRIITVPQQTNYGKDGFA